MRYMLLALGVFVAIAGIAAPRAAAADDWRTYRNPRYGTTIDYPDFFRADAPPENGDGQVFKSADGAEFSVFASYNALDLDLAGLQDFVVKNLAAGEVMTYRAHGDNWFVISGTKGADTVFYERHLLSHGGQMTEGFVISYPKSLKQTYDPIVARMSKSFRSGTGYQSPGKP